MYWYGGQYDKAIEEARKCLKLKDNWGFGLLIMGYGYAEKGMYEDAIAAHRKAVAENPYWRYALGRTYAMAGRINEAN